MTDKQKPLVMVVEDDKFLTIAYRNKLSQSNFELEFFADGESAITRLKQDPRPSIILLDLLIPKINGVEVLKFIKSEPNLNEIPVLILSNQSEKKEVDHCLELGASDYLVKADITISSVVDKVKAYL